MTNDPNDTQSLLDRSFLRSVLKGVGARRFVETLKLFEVHGQEMLRQISSEDIAQRRKSAHMLHGASSNLGMVPLAAAIQQASAAMREQRSFDFPKLEKLFYRSLEALLAEGNRLLEHADTP
ncbi:MAG: hypothetical protein HQL53_05235 [Magnetococcales bacterium]|nr:hypothetical protein [Magnetococcales bacterium]